MHRFSSTACARNHYDCAVSTPVHTLFFRHQQCYQNEPFVVAVAAIWFPSPLIDCLSTSNEHPFIAPLFQKYLQNHSPLKSKVP